MAGQGKYTIYAPESNSKNNLLAKLFPASPTAAYVGKEVEYRNVVVDSGNSNLLASKVQGDPYFGPDVNMDYAESPNLLQGAEGSWRQPGDPANSYVPDLTSPGPGKTDGVDKSDDPGLSAEDVKPTYVPGGPQTGTRNPADQAKKIASQVLGTDSKMKLGSSDSSGS